MRAELAPYQGVVTYRNWRRHSILAYCELLERTGREVDGGGIDEDFCRENKELREKFIRGLGKKRFRSMDASELLLVGIIDPNKISMERLKNLSDGSFDVRTKETAAYFLKREILEVE